MGFVLKGSAGCSNSQAEFFLSSSGSTYDISLVNGYSGPVSITGGTNISVTSGNKYNPGVGVYH